MEQLALLKKAVPRPSCHWVANWPAAQGFLSVPGGRLAPQDRAGWGRL